jgi:hypothetical protein
VQLVKGDKAHPLRLTPRGFRCLHVMVP